ncbi:MAG: ABC transporter substrate-binding protein [Alphaproteobacteria bacterium]|nr:ABC transporter substrate-binding protein [Alphaproteobacteria bacterium]
MTGVIHRQWLQGIVAGFAFAILAAMLAPSANAAAPGEEAEAFLNDLAVTGIALLEKGDYTKSERELKFREIVSKGFALKAIGKFVVGRYWRKMDSAQQDEYQELFSEWLLKTYANRLGGYRGQTVEIVKSIETESRYKDVIVTTRITLGNGQPSINVDWRVRKFGNEYKVIDLSFEGASMIGTQRKEFESVIQKIGVTGLIDNLRGRLAVLMADSG